MKNDLFLDISNSKLDRLTAMSLAIAPDRSLYENNTAPTQLAVKNNKNGGFLSTLASYLTSTQKSDPKSAGQRKKLMESWDDVDLQRINQLVCNVLYNANYYEPLLHEIERVVGKRREHCFYGAVSVFLGVVLLHDAIGAVTAFMTLILPAILTLATISSPASYESPTFLKDHHDFFVRYWTVYAVFVTSETFIASLIQWDLRLLRLVFMSACLSSRLPILAHAHGKILGIVENVRQLIDTNNIEPSSTKKIH